MRQPNSFNEPVSKKRGKTNNFFFGGRLVSRIFEEFKQPAIETKMVQHFRDFLRRKDYIQDACRRTLNSFQKFKTKICKIKTNSGYFLIRGLSNGTTLKSIKSGRRVPFKTLKIIAKCLIYALTLSILVNCNNVIF